MVFVAELRNKLLAFTILLSFDRYLPSFLTWVVDCMIKTLRRRDTKSRGQLKCEGLCSDLLIRNLSR